MSEKKKVKKLDQFFSKYQNKKKFHKKRLSTVAKYTLNSQKLPKLSGSSKRTALHPVKHNLVVGDVIKKLEHNVIVKWTHSLSRKC